MSVFQKLLGGKKKEIDEDEEALQEQSRVFAAAKAILDKKEMEKAKEIEEKQAQHAGITLINPDIDISQLKQEELDELIRRREEIKIQNANFNEDELAEIPIRQRKQALSSIFYTVETLENISKFNKDVVNKEKQLSQALIDIMNNDEQIK